MQQLLKSPGVALSPALGFPAGASAATATVQPFGLVPGAAPLLAVAGVAGGTVTATLTGGSEGERYTLTVTATIAGDSVERQFEVAVIAADWTTAADTPGYLSIHEFIEGFGLDEAVRMTDARGDGVLDRVALVRALAAAQAIVDGHLGTVTAVPLTTIPEIVLLALADLARARLYPRGCPEGVDQAAKEARRTLERIATGALPLPGLASLAAADTPSPVALRPGRTAYPDGLAGF